MSFACYTIITVIIRKKAKENSSKQWINLYTTESHVHYNISMYTRINVINFIHILLSTLT